MDTKFIKEKYKGKEDEIGNHLYKLLTVFSSQLNNENFLGFTEAFDQTKPLKFLLDKEFVAGLSEDMKFSLIAKLFILITLSIDKGFYARITLLHMYFNCITNDLISHHELDPCQLNYLVKLKQEMNS